MNPKYDILSIGTALVDSIIRGFDPVPVSRSGFRALSGSLHVGGEAVNEAIAASKLGNRTAILASVGEDAAGDLIRASLRDSGVDISFVLRSALHPTPVTTMFVREDGTRQSVTNEAHRYNFHPDQYAEHIRSARAVLLGSLFRAPFDDPEIVLSVVRAAKKSGAFVFADTKLPNFRRLSLDGLREVMPLLDCITPNEDEARFYSDFDKPEEMADVFLDYGVRNVVIKLGEKGCFFKNKERSIALPGHQVNAVDSTGAGDQFLAGFASEFLKTGDLEQALRFGNACGAIAVTQVGAAASFKNREEVLEWMKERENR